jgi:flavin reductase (DIM6/NTAB) family NADH-FMN oxidoreductase RutF
MSNSDFSEALVKFPLGVSVVTVGFGGIENGLTVSWATPISFEPMQFVISVDKNHYSVEILESTKNFVINVLKKEQTDLAAHFAKKSMTDTEKLASVSTREADSGGIILEDTLAYFDCEVVGVHEYGDHRIYIGKVIEAGVLGDGEPMTTLQGMQYRKKTS